jgi:hypothetical protein
MKVNMAKRIVRCSSGGHHIQVEIKEGYASARAILPEGNVDGSPGHNQACPICNRQLFIKYIP